MKCKYCNIEKSKYGLKVHEKYCSLNPGRIIRISFTKGRKGQIPWNKNLTKDIDSRLKTKSEKIKARYNSGELINHQKNKKRTEEEKRKIFETMKNNPNAGGLRQGSERGKKSWYESRIAGKVFLDSTWELEYVKYLDENNINWRRNKIKFPYEKEGKVRYYIPDFYLIDTDEYIEVKGFERLEDKLKWNAFPYKLTILKYKELTELGVKVKN